MFMLNLTKAAETFASTAAESHMKATFVNKNAES